MNQNGNRLLDKLNLFTAVVHGGGGDSGGGGGGGQNTTVQKSDPWAGQQPYLEKTFSEAQNLYDNNTPQYYQGQTVAPYSDTTDQYMAAAANRAVNGADYETSTKNMINATTSGDYLNAGNPYLQDKFNTVSQTLTPQMEGKFEASNRYGSGAATAATANALANEYGNMAYQNYADERGNQLKASLVTPNMNAMDWGNLGQLNNVGVLEDNYNQQVVNADIQKWNYNQQLPYEKLNSLAGITNNGSYGSSGVSTATQQTYRQPILSGAGGAIGGALAGNAIFGGGGAAVGGLLGGAAGYYG